jgi:hypothetical protein
MLPPTFFDDKNTTASGSVLGCGIYQFTNTNSITPRGISARNCNGAPYAGIASLNQTVTTPCLVDGTVVPASGVTFSRISNCTD